MKTNIMWKSISQRFYLGFELTFTVKPLWAADFSTPDFILSSFLTFTFAKRNICWLLKPETLSYPGVQSESFICLSVAP